MMTSKRQSHHQYLTAPIGILPGCLPGKTRMLLSVTTFTHFDTVQECDRQTDRQRNDRANTVPAPQHMVIGPHCHVPSSLSHHPLHSPVFPPSFICLIMLPPLYITHFPAFSDCLSSIFLSDALFTSISYHRCSSTSSAPVQSLSSCLPSSLW